MVEGEGQELANVNQEDNNDNNNNNNENEDDDDEKAIKNITVTFTAVSPGEQYKRFGKLDEFIPVFFWSTHQQIGDEEQDPIVSIKIIDEKPNDEENNDNNNENNLENFEKINIDINNGSDETYPTYLWIKRSSEEKGINELGIIETGDPLPAQFKRFKDNLFHSKSEDFVKRATIIYKLIGQKIKHEVMKVGSFIDCRDTINKWCGGKIKNESETHWEVHYVGWSDKWDEWIEKDSPRIAPKGTKVSGNTAPRSNDAAYKLKDDELIKFRDSIKKFKSLKQQEKDGKELDKQDISFLTKEISLLVSKALNSVIDDETIIPEVQLFFQSQLDVVIDTLDSKEKELPKEYLHNFVRIFGGDQACKRFYSKYGVSGDTEQNRDGEFAVGNNQDGCSIYLIENINYFGKKGGFKLITDLWKQKDGFNFRDITLLVWAFDSIRNFLSKKFSRATLPDFCKTLLQRLKNITDKELKELPDKQSLGSIIDSLKNLMMTYQDGNDVLQVVEKLNLDLSLRLIGSGFLAKRINGITDLNSIISKLDRQEGFAADADAQEEQQFLTKDYLVKWIQDNKVVEILLGPDSHQQILQRTPPILKFLASSGALQERHLLVLWKSTLGKHETIVRALYGTMAELATELNLEQLSTVYEAISSTQGLKYTELLLTFMRTFISNAASSVNNRDEVKEIGNWLGFFWQVIQNSTDPKVQQVADEILVSLVKTDEFASTKRAWIDKAIESIKKHVSVPQSLNLLQEILESYMDDRVRYGNEDNLIDELEEKHHLISLVVDDTFKYKKNAGETKEDEKADELYQGATSQRNIGARLGFLEFLVQSSQNVNLTNEHVKSLWEILMKQDAQVFLQWLGKVRDNERGGKCAAFDNKTTLAIFSNLICKKVNFKTLDLEGYKCFDIFFRYVNYQARNLESIGRRVMKVINFKGLVGVESVWNICAVNSDPQTYGASSKLLTYLYTRLVHSDKFGRKEASLIGQQFVEKCMGLIKEQETNEDSEILNRLVNLLKQFLQTVNESESDEYVLSVQVNDEDDDNDNDIKVTLGGDSLIGMLRKELAAHIEHETELLQFTYKGQILYPALYDNVNIKDAGIEGTHPIVARKLTRQQFEDQPKPIEGMEVRIRSPLWRLSNTEKFSDALFHLLDLGGAVADNVWSLLKTLPVNEDLGVALKSINYDYLLGSESATKLYYVVDKMERQLGKERDMNEWRAKFLKTGGVAKLVAKLLKMKVNFNHSLQLKSVLLIVQIVNRFRKEKVDIPVETYLPRLVHLLEQAVAVNEEQGEDEKETPRASLGRNILKFVMANIKNTPNLLKYVYAGGDWAKIILNGLIAHNSESVREIISSTILDISSAFDPEKVEEGEGEGKNEQDVKKTAEKDIPKPDKAYEPRQKFLPLLLTALTSVDTKSNKCAQYFAVIKNLVANTELGTNLDIADLSVHLSKKIKVHPIVEKKSSDDDIVLQGLLGLIGALLAKDKELKRKIGGKDQGGLIKQIYEDLFLIPDSVTAKEEFFPPKCKSASSRKAAFELLQTLVQDEPHNLAELVEYLIPNHSGNYKPQSSQWDLIRDSRFEEKSDTGYVGLKNLGCICYMNALMQQLFMIPRLRENLLKVEDKTEDKSDSFFYQLQQIMAFLQESEKMYCDPDKFCKAFKDWDGNPTNVSIQMDTQEFLNMLFDRIDTQVKGSPAERTLKDVIGGVFSNELIGVGCEHYKEREEEFYCISLNVKDKKNIQESLQDFVTHEPLEGANAYMCSKCKKKVDTHKRTCVKKLPETLILHLKRFEFDFNTMQKKKLNDLLAFPYDEVIDMKPFTKEGLGSPRGDDDGKGKESEEGPPDSHYKYRLKGCLVHTGYADRGHYYSYIQERVPEDLLGKAKGRWMCFNDRDVRYFDPDKIPEECFGGSDEQEERGSSRFAGRGNNGQVTNSGMMRTKTRNSYLLFYDRIPANDSEVQKLEEKAPYLQKADRQRGHVHKEQFDQIWDENIAFWKDKSVMDQSYVQLMRSIAQKFDVEKSKGKFLENFAKLYSSFIFTTLGRYENAEDTFPDAIQTAKKLFVASKESCIWLLKEMTSKGWGVEYLLQTREGSIQKSVAALVNLIVGQALGIKKDEEKVSETEEKKETSAVEAVEAFMTHLLDNLKIVPKTYRNMDTYFHVIFNYSTLCKTTFFSDYKIIPKMIDLFLGNQSPEKVLELPISSKTGKRRTIFDSYYKPEFKFFLKLLSSVVCKQDKFTELDEKFVLNKTFLKRVMVEGITKKKGASVGKMICRLIKNNKQLTTNIIAFISNGIEEFATDDARPYFRVLQAMLLDEDELINFKIETIMQSLLANLEQQKQYWKDTDFVIDHIIRLAKVCKGVAKWLHENQDKLAWVQDWIEQNESPPDHHDENMKLKKPSKRGGYQHHGYAMQAHYGLHPKDKLDLIKSIRKGDDLENDVSDSARDLADRIFKIGQEIDVKDTIDKWEKAVIIDLTETEVLIHYKKWSSKWDEHLERGSERISLKGQRGD